MDIMKGLIFFTVILLSGTFLMSCVTTGGPEDVAALAKAMENHSGLL